MSPTILSVCLTAVAGVLGTLVLLSVGYLLLLLISAVASLPGLRHRRQAPLDVAPEKIAVVIPAHNEEPVIAATLDSLRQQDYPSHRFTIVVVADNCEDTTAQIAREHGAIVLERSDLVKRGKGYALEWAFERLLGPESPVDRAGERTSLFTIVDADTWVAPDFLSLINARVRYAGVSHAAQTPMAFQGRYGVLNPEGGWRAAMMTAAFDLVNHVKLLGCDFLKLNVGLKGNGMAFSRAILEQARWQGHSITEDIDYGLDLLQNHGIRVNYAPEARVLAQMPVNSKQAASQRERWERGRYQLLRQRASSLIRQGIRRGDFRLFCAALDLSIPPLAELVALMVAWGVVVVAGASLAVLPNPTFWYAALAGCVLGLVAYVLGGLGVAQASPQAYLALLFAPGYIVWKFGLYLVRFVAKRLGGKGKKPTGDATAVPVAEEWVRTERIPIAKTPTPSVMSVTRDENATATKEETAQLRHTVRETMRL